METKRIITAEECLARANSGDRFAAAAIGALRDLRARGMSVHDGWGEAEQARKAVREVGNATETMPLAEAERIARGSVPA